MKFKYIYRHKRTGTEYTFLELESLFRLEFKDFRDFNSWVDEKFEEVCIPLDKTMDEKALNKWFNIIKKGEEKK